MSEVCDSMMRDTNEREKYVKKKTNMGNDDKYSKKSVHRG